MTIILNPYKIGSSSAKSLRTAISLAGVKTLVLNRKPNKNTPLLVNWGSQHWVYEPGLRKVMNHPMYIHKMSNKLEFFQATAHDPLTPEWTTSREEAQAWASANGEKASKVFARHLLNSSGGKGIRVVDAHGQVPYAPLYTKHFPKTHEYRIHLARYINEGISAFTPLLVQRKVFKKSEVMATPKTWDIRNHDNGFIFQQHPQWQTTVPAVVIEAATRIMSQYFGVLHFAALDVLYHQGRNKAVVIEGNTAPGLENTTLDKYAEYFKKNHAIHYGRA